MSSTSSNTRLPRHIDPRKFANQGLDLQGDIAVSDLNRLASLVLDKAGEVKVVLEFGVDEERHRVITGEAQCAVSVTCQRCLEPVEIVLDAEINLAMVWDEERAKQLPKTLDPLILPEGPADIYTIIEDELLLELPMVSYHDKDCIEQTSFGDEEVVTETKSSKNPFQVLEQLKGSPKS
jgi:uncharacterized protein